MSEMGTFVTGGFGPGSGTLLGDPFAIGNEPTASGTLDTSAALFAGLAMVVVAKTVPDLSLDRRNTTFSHELTS